jgi:ribonucleoside-diphosphate reductase alpha chain
MKNKQSLEFKPIFVEEGKKAVSLFKWKKHDSRITGENGKDIYNLKAVLAPMDWSPTAIDIAASKYFRRTVKQENSIQALVDRIGLGLKAAADQSGLFSNSKESSNFVEELKFIMLSQMAAFNSPVWFNLGLRQAYGVSSKSHHWYWNPKKKNIVETDDAFLHPQSSACFIQSIEDSLESIFDLVKSEAKLFKYGSGSGTNFSNLRGKNEHLSSGGQSSGLISFLEVLDKAAGAIKSGGTTRRAAKMVCVDIDHPEIEEFIVWKMNEEKKAKALIAAGFSSDLDGETYRTISGQNANNSVRIPDRFMKMIGQGKFWKLKNRFDKASAGKIKADELWKKICEAAWACADPGLQFDDTINKFHTCPESGKISASNPCSEYMFLDDSACNLASINLAKFITDQGEFNFHEYCHVLRCLFIAQECLVDFSSYPTKKIAENSHRFRPLGLGFANLGSFLMRKGLAYDSDEGRTWAGFLSATMTGVAYKTSAEMAQKIGAFQEFKKNKTPMLKVMKMHQSALSKIQWRFLQTEYKTAAFQIWNQVLESGNKFGYRNAQATVIAPTGTIGLVMDCDTTGIEPDFSLIKMKKLSGGGYLKIVNHSIEPALRYLGYSELEINKILEGLSEDKNLKSAGVRPEHLNIFSCATGENALSPDAHLKMMAAVQPFVSGAISKTVNLPNQSSVKEVSETYLKAWKLGLKAVAVYRDGSKFVQPLSSDRKNKLYPKCTECGSETILESGCYRCLNCGTTTACSS